MKEVRGGSRTMVPRHKDVCGPTDEPDPAHGSGPGSDSILTDHNEATGKTPAAVLLPCTRDPGDSGHAEGRQALPKSGASMGFPEKVCL